MIARFLKILLPGNALLLLASSACWIGADQIGAQELSGLRGKDPFALSGSFSQSLLMYEGNSAGIPRKPLAYTFGAALNLSFYGISMPLSASYSNERWTCQQPFNRLALHPSWKNIRSHIGDISLSFSPYSLNGINCRGAGLEVQDAGPFSFTVFAGRILKRVLGDTLLQLSPAYTRMGAGVKTLYAGEKIQLGLSLFYAKDNSHSLPSADSLLPEPAMNLVTEFTTRIILWKNLSLRAELAESYLLGDPGFPEQTRDANPAVIKSPVNRNAFKTGLEWTLGKGSFGLGLERIEPGYRTLGAYYNTEDLITCTMQYNGNLLNEKLSVGISSGMEQDNLEDLKNQTNRRLANSINLNLHPGKKLDLSLLYSGFSSYTSLRNPFDNINSLSPYGQTDTLDFTQVTGSFGLSGTAVLEESEKWNQQLTASFSLQNTKTSLTPSRPGQFMNGILGWTLSHKPSRFNGSVNFLLNHSGQDSAGVFILGPSLSLRKSLFEKKWQLNGIITYNQSRKDRSVFSDTWIYRLGTTCRLSQHAFDLSVLYNKRNNPLTGTTSALTLNLSWRYTFKTNRKSQHSDPGQVNESNFSSGNKAGNESPQ
ncbi:MAG: hypothetical protein U0T82_07665 [Bacteroidales bacterium]